MVHVDNIFAVRKVMRCDQFGEDPNKVASVKKLRVAVVHQVAFA